MKKVLMNLMFFIAETKELHLKTRIFPTSKAFFRSRIKKQRKRIGRNPSHLKLSGLK